MILAVLALAAPTFTPVLSASTQYRYGNLLVEFKGRAFLISGIPLALGRIPLPGLDVFRVLRRGDSPLPQALRTDLHLHPHLHPHPHPHPHLHPDPDQYQTPDPEMRPNSNTISTGRVTYAGGKTRADRQGRWVPTRVRHKDKIEIIGERTSGDRDMDLRIVSLTVLMHVYVVTAL